VFIYIHIMYYYELLHYLNLCLSVMFDSALCSFTSISCIVKEQLVVINDMDVNEHKALSNITLKHKSR
jgi:hypothetical protein